MATERPDPASSRTRLAKREIVAGAFIKTPTGLRVIG